MSKVDMDAVTSNISDCDDDRRDLEHLHDAFGSVVSLDDIASAYCQSGRDVYLAGEILCNLQGSTSTASTYTSKEESEGLSVSSEGSDDNLLDKSNLAEGHSTGSKQKRNSASIGTISGVIGREYSQSRPLRNEHCELKKPLKLNLLEFPISDIWSEKVPPNMTSSSDTVHKDIEDFLFQMLGDGFQLDMTVIQEVLGRCGYNVERSMEKLLDLSATTLEKSDDVFRTTVHKPIQKNSAPECINSARSGKARFTYRNESPKSDRNSYDLQKELLEALFTAPERFEAEPKRTRPVKEVRTSGRFGRVVGEPLKDSTPEFKTAVAKFLVSENGNEEDEANYQILRKRVREYWVTMKEYYKAAVDAFAKGDQVRANIILEQGHFFKKKAREADEKSAQMFLEPREEEMSLDLQEYSPKEAVRLLRVHLTSFSGISSIQYLKVIVGANSEETKEVARKRLVIKLLEEESIKWSEEGNGGTIVIRLDEVDPKRLSFANKSVTSGL